MNPAGRLPKRLAALAIALLAALPLTACSVHFDAGAPRLPERDTQQVARDNAANLQNAIAEGAAHLANDNAGEDAPTLTEISHQARTRLDAFGGIWQPWSPADQEEYPNLPEPTRPPTPTTTAELLQTLLTCQEQAWADAEVTPEKPFAHLLAATALACGEDATKLSQQTGQELPPTPTATPSVADPTVEDPKPTPPTLSDQPYDETQGEQAQQIVLDLDFSRYILYRAAATNPDTLPSDWQTQANDAESFADQLVALGAIDNRQPAYTLPEGLTSADGAKLYQVAAKQIFSAQWELLGPLNRAGLDLQKHITYSYQNLLQAGIDLGPLPGIEIKGDK